MQHVKPRGVVWPAFGGDISQREDAEAGNDADDRIEQNRRRMSVQDSLHFDHTIRSAGPSLAPSESEVSGSGSLPTEAVSVFAWWAGLSACWRPQTDIVLNRMKGL